MTKRHIFVTEKDYKKLKELLLTTEANYRDRKDLISLEAELQKAKIVDSKEVPENIVTMNTRLIFCDLENNNRTEATLVFPSEASIENGKLSVLSPIGTGLLGYAKGDTIEWTVPGGIRRIQIEDILYQPEASVNKKM